MTALAAHLEARRAGGRKLLVPYLVAGIPDRTTFPQALEVVAEQADAVEIGIPYSDPLMDGPVIAAAATRALEAGVGPVEALRLAAGTATPAPRVAMTYYNPIHRRGHDAFCSAAAEAGLSGLIVPDLPLEESDDLQRAAAAAGLAWIPLVSPTSSPDRVKTIAAGATGFVYAVSTLGVTGARTRLSERAAAVARACRAATDRPVLVGIGISNEAQAAEAAQAADGVVIGSAVVSLVLENGAAAAAAFLARVRGSLDEVGQGPANT